MSVDGDVLVGGFVDHHTHLLKTAAGLPWPWEGTTVRDFHERVWRDGSTPMDIPDPVSGDSPGELAARLRDGLAQAAALGLVEVTEMGMRDWSYTDALVVAEQAGPLPLRVKIYLASGLAESASLAELGARRADAGAWVRLEGIKFYADGWLVPRTCAMCQDFDDTGRNGLLFTDAAKLARRIEPFAAAGWRIATHAIGDLGVQTVLDAYELVWGRDAAAIAAARPRVEHASLMSADAIARMAELGVWACIQPSFPVTDASHVAPALGADRALLAYPWAALAKPGTPLLVGTDYPIEVLDPLVGLARLVNGRSDRPGFATSDTAPEHSRLPLDLALALACDESAGRTLVSADPRAVTAPELDQLRVVATEPVPF
ncbi:MAG TPA: amidohydrolase family protein [Streptosporangiaceae bacterium]|nr:amidohydrolase family protein [Streptosporangiaceae bacterium]